jgi:hypothetical protein
LWLEHISLMWNTCLFSIIPLVVKKMSFIGLRKCFLNFVHRCPHLNLPLYNKKVLHIIFVYKLVKDHNLFSPNITWVIISRKMKLAGYITCLIFYILLTMHLGIILVNNQLDALFSMYLFPFSACFEQPSAHYQKNRIVSIHHLVYVTPCTWLPGMPVTKELPDRHTRQSVSVVSIHHLPVRKEHPDRHTTQSPTQSDIYQMMYWYNSILLMMSTGMPKHVEKGNK